MNIHFEAGSGFIPAVLPCCDIVSEAFRIVDAAAEILALDHADLALEHIEPAGVL